MGKHIRHRSSVTGRWITTAQAVADPQRTQSETVGPVRAALASVAARLNQRRTDAEQAR